LKQELRNPGLLDFRQLHRSDFPLLHRWLAEPHVVEWWHEPLDLPAIHAKYNPRIDGTEPTRVFIIEHDQRAIGWIQWYHWRDYPAHATLLGAGPASAGIDLAIGEMAMLGAGLGPKIIREFLDAFVFGDPAITAIICDPEERNIRSIRAFEKAGFGKVRTVQLAGEAFTRSVMSLPRPPHG